MTNEIFNRSIILDHFILKNFVELSNEDIELTWRLRNDPSIAKWMYSDKGFSLEEHSIFIERLKDIKHMVYYLVVDLKKSDPIGVIYLKNLDLYNKYAYLGVYSNIHSKFKNKGDTLIMLLKKLAFDIFELNTLKLEVIATNEKAINLYHRNGFVLEGALRQFVFKNNSFLDVLIMGMLKDEYRTS